MGKKIKKAHPGFQNVANQISRSTGESKENASKMLATSTRRASSGAKKANPRLKKVKGY